MSAPSTAPPFLLPLPANRVYSHTPKLNTIADLPRRVLAIATHACDEVLGCGGVLALHAQRGDQVEVLLLTVAEGSASASACRALAAELGLQKLVFLGLPTASLASLPELVGLLEAEVARCKPELLYAPAPSELHKDRRAASRAILAAVAQQKLRLHLYAIQSSAAANVLYDTSSVSTQKERALAAGASSLVSPELLEQVRAGERSHRPPGAASSLPRAEAFLDLGGAACNDHAGRMQVLRSALEGTHSDKSSAVDPWAATAVISNWNKLRDVRENLSALRAQTRPFARIVVVDNASTDGSIAMIHQEFPEVHLIVMPHSRYGACETFNIGFANSHTPLTAILDDDVVLPPEWLEKSIERLQAEPETTAILSTKVVEPGMPDSFKASPEVNRERYMSTFRGCASLARSHALREAGGYDERLFIYGNERDLTCRLLNLGYRVLQYPSVHVFHKTPFGMKMGKRSLYYHARNAWLGMLKYAPLGDLLRMPFLVLSKVVLRTARAEAQGSVTDAVGTIGLSRALRETPGAWWVLLKAAASVLYNIPYCLARREPVRAPDFELPLH